MTFETNGNSEWMLLGTSDYQEAKRVQSLLLEMGVEIQLIRKPEDCSKGGCKVTVDVMAHSQDLDKIRTFFEDERNKAFEGLVVDGGLLSEVFDPEKSEARCPACGTQFSTESKECPDCGLVFIVE